MRAHDINSQILLRSNATRSMDPDVARLPVIYEPEMFYIAMVGLGAYKSFHQDAPLYPWSSSTTYRPIACNTHPLCKGDKCNVDGQCTYVSGYESGSVTSGILSEEKFTFDSDTGGLENIELQFGCGRIQENFEDFIGKNHLRGKPDLITGILGLGLGQWSFLNQLGAVGQGKFSYCFETFNQNMEGSDTYLRFGEDAIIGRAGQEVHITPIVVPKFETSYYFLNLEDISVGNKRIGFPKGTFKLSSRGVGGSAIDSGTPISIMYKDRFDRIADLVKANFNELGVEYIGPQQSFDVCFRLRGKFDINKYPYITLHFQQADYVISDYKANFVILGEIVCLGISRGDIKSPSFILGANQQANKRILYNVMDWSLSFATEYCELGS
ncbi:aspartic proteinase CDR1-like [Papaver somniferum]|uniref:aspartic proteinase CDR1-like n=1 Tax=Papaver somniferum TaxID=3469 RepID=UPI000E6FDFCF|nr:aspartic proteinase CDR1-like [Papaver somniferum]